MSHYIDTSHDKKESFHRCCVCCRCPSVTGARADLGAPHVPQPGCATSATCSHSSKNSNNRLSVKSELISTTKGVRENRVDPKSSVKGREEPASLVEPADKRATKPSYNFQLVTVRKSQRFQSTCEQETSNESSVCM